jgi:hypothetical protein
LPNHIQRLERPQVEALIAHLAGGKALPAAVTAHIVAKTDGVPLYVEELTKMLLASDLLRADAEHYMLTGPLSAMAIPETLQDSLMARLDQLAAAKEVAQLGAVLGREFAYDMLMAVSSQDEATVQDGLTRLVAAELLYQRGRLPRTDICSSMPWSGCGYTSLLRSTATRCSAGGATLRNFPRSSRPAELAASTTLLRAAPAGGGLLAAGGRTRQRPVGPSGSYQPIDHRD